VAGVDLGFILSVWQVEGLPSLVSGAISTTVNNRVCLYFFCFMAKVFLQDYLGFQYMRQSLGFKWKYATRLCKNVYSIQLSIPMNVFVAK
jgi:hypothetical protein